MRNKKMFGVLAATAIMASVCSPVGALAEEASMDALTEIAAEESVEDDVEDYAEGSEEAQPETEDQDKAAQEAAAAAAAEEAAAESEASAEVADVPPFYTLKEAGYQSSALNDMGWQSDFYDLKYAPAEGVKIGVEENKTLEEYYARNDTDTEDNKVATSEMVAFAGDSYIQIMSEVNPNKSEASQILKDFIDSEGFIASGPVGKTSLGNMEFATADGKINGNACRLAVTTDKDGFALVYKLVYDNDATRDLLLKGFAPVHEAESEETEPEALPAETEADVQTEAETGAETETAAETSGDIQ